MRNRFVMAWLFLLFSGLVLQAKAELTEPGETSPRADESRQLPQFGDLCVTNQENAGGILTCKVAQKQAIGGDCKCADTANLSPRKVPGKIREGSTGPKQEVAATILPFPLRPANDNVATYLCVDGVDLQGDFRILCQKNGRTISSHFSVMECNLACGK